MLRITFVVFVIFAPSSFAMPTYRICENMTTRDGSLSSNEAEMELASIYRDVMHELHSQFANSQSASTPISQYVRMRFRAETGRDLDLSIINTAPTLIQSYVRQYARTHIPYLSGRLK